MLRLIVTSLLSACHLVDVVGNVPSAGDVSHNGLSSEHRNLTDPEIPSWTAADGAIFCLIVACWCLAVARLMHKLDSLGAGGVGTPALPKARRPPMNIERVHICDEPKETVIYGCGYAVNSRMSACLAERAARIDSLRRMYEQEEEEEQQEEGAAERSSGVGGGESGVGGGESGVGGGDGGSGVGCEVSGGGCGGASEAGSGMSGVGSKAAESTFTSVQLNSDSLVYSWSY